MSKGLDCLERLKAINESGSGYIEKYYIEPIEKELKTLEIIKKYVYYSKKSHCIRMREIRKSTHNFDYEDLKEMLENE